MLAQAVLAELGEVGGDALGQVFLEQPRGDRDRIGDARGGGAAVAFHHHAVEPEEDRAVVVVGIEMVLQQLGRRARDQEAELRAQRAGEARCAAGRSTKRAAPSIAFSAILPENPSVTTTSTSPRLILSASMKPSNSAPAPVAALQLAGGFLQLVGALGLLGADVEQAHARRARSPVTIRE